MHPTESPGATAQSVAALIVTCFVVLITGFISVARRVVQETGINWLVILTEYAACLVVAFLAYEAYPEMKPHFPAMFAWVSHNMVTVTGAWVGIRAFHLAEELTNNRFSK